MWRKSVHSLLFFVLAVTVVLSGCSSSSSNGDKEPSASTQEGSGDGKLAPYEITIAFWGPDQRDLGLVEQEISKITKEKINATVKLKRIEAAAWTQQKVLMFSGNEKIDLVFTGEDQYISEVAQKKLLPIDDLLQSHGQDILAAFDPDVLAAAKIDGKIYGVPTIRDFAAYPTILMRTDWLKESNIDVSQVKTVEDLEPIFASVKKKHPEANMLGKASGGGSIAYPLLQTTIDPLGDMIGVLTDPNQLKVVNLYESEEYAKFIGLIHKWFLAGYIPKDIATTSQTGRDYIKANIGFATPNKGKPGITTQTGAWAGKELTEVALAPPKMNTLTIMNAMLAIAAKSKNPERSMMFLNLLYSDKQIINLLDWGIEGKHYQVKEDGTIDFPEGVDATNSGYNMRQGWMFGNQLLSYPWSTDSPDIWKQMEAFNQSAEKSAALGFTYNSEPVKTELAAIQNVVQQYSKALETGTLDPDVNLPKFNAALKSAGIDKVIAEKQRQLDAWAASNK
ncbi:putative aldouronate transport system substrate-binding protein [Paenibacillus rhizosphaerae]|uniref:Putative aldouronate transport system substrate-binding protein n=1 Tax=Paenibacillus rhizosphaerae TaxID=297318 RepID=A0A839TNE4_9BACL|nr:ABC transporter substrate-binding protein [Paenibacillus rhizosphaerae]MBB3128192.1 putative aldouronate transport system substrate-binding protein [Paenibacillus rhizosphaerae]